MERFVRGGILFKSHQQRCSFFCLARLITHTCPTVEFRTCSGCSLSPTTASMQPSSAPSAVSLRNEALRVAIETMASDIAATRSKCLAKELEVKQLLANIMGGVPSCVESKRRSSTASAPSESRLSGAARKTVSFSLPTDAGGVQSRLLHHERKPHEEEDELPLPNNRIDRGDSPPCVTVHRGNVAASAVRAPASSSSSIPAESCRAIDDTRRLLPRLATKTTTRAQHGQTKPFRLLCAPFDDVCLLPQQHEGSLLAGDVSLSTSAVFLDTSAALTATDNPLTTLVHTEHILSPTTAAASPKLRDALQPRDVNTPTSSARSLRCRSRGDAPAREVPPAVVADRQQIDDTASRKNRELLGAPRPLRRPRTERHPFLFEMVAARRALARSSIVLAGGDTMILEL